jgi:lysophospholipase L1-like esterase
MASVWGDQRFAPDRVAHYDRRMERSLARRALTAMLVTALALALYVTPASAVILGPSTAFTPGSTYLALGDSVTFGYLENTVVPAPRYHDQAYFLGYPEHLAKELHAKVVNPACPGETSASLINAKAQSNGCENSLGGAAGYRTLYPLHVAYTGSQLVFAVHYLKSHPSVRLVSLMIGANDLFLCMKQLKDGCLSSSDQKALRARTAHNIRIILAAIRTQAHYHGQLIVVHYYSLNDSLALYNSVSESLNAAETAGAAGFHVKFADGFGIWAAHTRNFGGNTCAAGLLTRWGPGAGTCGVHPSFAGQSLLAEAVLRALTL